MRSTIPPKKTRGPNKQTPWARNPEEALSVLRLALDIGDPFHRRLLEGMFASAFSLRRALQRDVTSKCRAYRSAYRERDRKGPGPVRARLGLDRVSVEHLAYRHLDRAPHLRRFMTKALAMHMADSVWSATERHLFRDAKGRTHGLPRAGRWFDFFRIPGRARSHTTQRKWETFRLHGSLSGHRAAYSKADGRFLQPRRMCPITAGENWWTYAGPLAVVFTGLPGGSLVLPVRLPSSPSNQPILDHHLANPERWHKIDLVRRRDANAPGGWRYEAHLIVLTTPFASAGTIARREKAARETADRRAGIDVNVSNVTLASHVNGEDLRVTRIDRDAGQRHAERRRARRERHRQRALERSRRAANPEQYHLSKRQQERAMRRALAGLPTQEVIPRGSRKARSDGKPLQAFRRDRLSASYRRERAAQAAAAESAARARRDHARRIAAALVLRHGFRAVVEDCNLSSWARHWGRSLSAFSPGTLLQAIERESIAVAKHAGIAGGVLRASTHTTALSQHCLCGHRVEKRLEERLHLCPACGVMGDRDAVSAALGSFVELSDPTLPASARVRFDAARAALGSRTRQVLLDSLQLAARGRQDAPSESTAPSALDGSSVANPGRTPSPEERVARQTVGLAPRTTPDETDSRQTTPERSRTRSLMLRNGKKRLTPLRDTS